LRARGEDVPALLNHYMQIAAKELGVEAKTLAEDAAEALGRYSWPGNVRELVNLCRRLTVLAPGSEVHVDDLPVEITSTGAASRPADDWIDSLTAGGPPATTNGRPLLDGMPGSSRTIRVALKHAGTRWRSCSDGDAIR
jgi:two-component system nitrogen regulation response regulator GlnG